VLAILGTAVSLTFVITLNRWNAVAAAIALVVGGIIYAISRPTRVSIG